MSRSTVGGAVKLPPVAAGVDGSAESLAAAAWAAREAVRRERALRLVHAWYWNPRQEEDGAADAVRRQPAAQAVRQAEEHVRAVCPGVDVSCAQVSGPATAALLAAAAEADLLVLGSRGMSGFTGFLVGSVALGVVARAARPVVLVRAGGATAAAPPPVRGDGVPADTGHGDVVLGVDADDPCDEAVEFAFETARNRRARLRAVHAWQPPDLLDLGPGDIGLMPACRQAEDWLGYLSAVLQVWREKYSDVEVLETVAEGRASRALLRAATGAGLLVVGRRPTARPGGPRTGPVIRAVIHHVDCPVAVVPRR
ncbi:universal stress protein [Streptomyces minutiscleroticus]|uniref:universal stress protein n=1 Tax=Streptomyces minutiscleroticus TaxID=68238 RepID=UPI00167DF143|nr:universal stress protein [Streptomyces minutiscleroticus]